MAPSIVSPLNISDVSVEPLTLLMCRCEISLCNGACCSCRTETFDMRISLARQIQYLIENGRLPGVLLILDSARMLFAYNDAQ